MRRGAGLRRELEDDPVEARLMRDPNGGQLHGRPAVGTTTVIEAAERAKIGGGGLGWQGRRGSRRRARSGRGHIDHQPRVAELQHPDALRRGQSDAVREHPFEVAQLRDFTNRRETWLQIGRSTSGKVNIPEHQLEAGAAVERYLLTAGIANEPGRLLPSEVPGWDAAVEIKYHPVVTLACVRSGPDVR